jgi:hypothetical protein
MYTNFSLNSVASAEFKKQKDVQELILTDGSSYLSLSVVTVSTKSLDDIDRLEDLLRSLRERVMEELETRAKKDRRLAQDLEQRRDGDARSRLGGD